jgi:hypothetical protein
MAGKRQHYLPQFPQRGFVSESGGRKTWLYRKNVPPREAGLRDVGVEQNFYDIDPGSSVDETITDIEREEFVGLVEQARSGRAFDAPTSSLVPKFVAHLEVRGRHLRTNIGAQCERAWNDMLGLFEQPSLGAALVRAHLKRNPGNVRKMAAAEIRSRGLPAHMAPRVAKQMVNMVSTMPDEILIGSFWAPLLPYIRATLKTRLLPSVKQAHLNALEKSVAPDERAEQYRGLQFSVVDMPSTDVILGDAAVLFRVDGPSAWKSFLEKGDDLIALYLPIASDRVLVGTSGERAIELTHIRQQIAKTSHSFFISSQCSVENVELSRRSEMPLNSCRRKNCKAFVDRSYRKSSYSKSAPSFSPAEIY